ncbi:MAG: glycosyltransferase [Clostridia bacterium]|nr:glycosyltransferase [Clostridia bacterium]
MKEKILYLSHIDWNWIKQRPQFIAEGLRAYFDVSVLFMFQVRNRKSLQKRSYRKENAKPFFLIPFAGRIAIISKINKIFSSIQFWYHLKKEKPQYIYVTYPLQDEFLPVNSGCKIIYDCMDNYTALCPEGMTKKIFTLENSLVNKADYILVSSNNLKQKLCKLYGDFIESKIVLVRNGYNGSILDVEPEIQKNKNEFTISYIGTVGKWFDFDMLAKSLDDFPNLNYRIIGPIDTEVINHSRIEYVGTVEHSKLYDKIKDTDCLIMPFVLNEIVEAVDPVKLYEYINYNMNILCVKYDEVERFEPFVHFYTDYESFKNEISELMNDSHVKYDAATRKEFLETNGWKARVETIEQLIHSN